MTNRSIISKLKANAVEELLADEQLFAAINSPDIKEFEQAKSLLNKHIFSYYQDPETLNKTITYLNIETHLPKSELKDAKWFTPTLEIWIISHRSCINFTEPAILVSNRNDYIAELLEENFNGRTSIGLTNTNQPFSLFGTLTLQSNIEGTLGQDYLYRNLLFRTISLNSSYYQNADSIQYKE